MSLISFSATRRRPAAWLALLAILLLFIAPVISKSLAQWRGSDSMMMHNGMMMPMAGMPESHHAIVKTGSPAPMSDHHPISINDDSACGYCVLLVHLPLDLMTLPLLWSSLQAATLPEVPLFQPVVARFVPRFFHPRAPPRYVV